MLKSKDVFVPCRNLSFGNRLSLTGMEKAVAFSFSGVSLLPPVAFLLCQLCMLLKLIFSLLPLLMFVGVEELCLGCVSICSTWPVLLFLNQHALVCLV